MAYCDKKKPRGMFLEKKKLIRVNVFTVHTSHHISTWISIVK